MPCGCDSYRHLWQWGLKVKKSVMCCLVVVVGVFVGTYIRSFAVEPVSGANTEKEVAPLGEPATEEPAATQPQVSPEQQAAAEKLGMPVMVTNSIGMHLVLIPAGEFLMGSPQSDKGARKDETPQHRVRITRPFYLGIHEVTQEQYERVMGVNPSHFKGEESQRPVEQVSWDDAVQFCSKLSELPGEKSAGRTYRLPTEAEWEYACRAGSTSKYCHGDDEARIDDYAWYRPNSDDTTHPVGQKKANAWGLYDMHGNVWEWCQDWYDAYPSSRGEGSTGTRYGLVPRVPGRWLVQPCVGLPVGVPRLGTAGRPLLY